MSRYVITLLTVLSLVGCIKGREVDPPREPEPTPDAGKPVVVMDAGMREDDAGGDDEDAGSVFGSDVCRAQIERAVDGLPEDLACTGLYDDVRNKVVSSRVRRFTPAVPLWSDGSGKQRWIHIPPGKTIDASDPDNWIFPVGTQTFKEFRVNGRRVETRIFQKVREDRWVRATYEWNRAETKATRSSGGDRPDIPIQGASYYIPTGRDCDFCHGGRDDRVLGFEAVSLGLAGAQGVTLRDLVDEGLITPAPTRTELAIGDDGTGLAAPVLGWLHINCGVTCHNDNQNAEAYSSGLFFELYPNELDGRPSLAFDALQTSVGVVTKTKRFGEGQLRIAAGSPEESLLFRYISTRGGPKEQMPPIATKVVDVQHVQLVRAWIEAL